MYICQEYDGHLHSICMHIRHGIGTPMHSPYTCQNKLAWPRALYTCCVLYNERDDHLIDSIYTYVCKQGMECASRPVYVYKYVYLSIHVYARIQV